MEIIGKVMLALPKKGGVSQKGNKWALQKFVIKEEGKQYPQSAVVEVFGEDKINEFNLRVGENVKVQFSIDADEFNDNWYNRLRVFAVERVDGTAQPQPQQQKRNYLKKGGVPVEEEQPEQDKLPF